MKKLMMLLAVLCVLAMPVTNATVANVELSQYSDEELLLLLTQIQCEIVNRGIEKTAFLEEGSYTAGIDIPVGSYIITPANADVSGYIDLRFPLNEQGMQPVKAAKNWKVGETDAVHLTIGEGEILYVKIPCNLTVSSGLVFE